MTNTRGAAIAWGLGKPSGSREGSGRTKADTYPGGRGGCGSSEIPQIQPKTSDSDSEEGASTADPYASETASFASSPADETASSTPVQTQPRDELVEWVSISLDILTWILELGHSGMVLVTVGVRSTPRCLTG